LFHIKNYLQNNRQYNFFSINSKQKLETLKAQSHVNNEHYKRRKRLKGKLFQEKMLKN